MVKSPFVADLINDLLVSRRDFSGLFVYGGPKRFVNIISRFDVSVKDCNKGRETVVNFMSEVDVIFTRFMALVHSWKGPKRSGCMRTVTKVSSEAENRIEKSPLGGEAHYISDPALFAYHSKVLKEKGSVEAGGYTFFMNFNPFALYKLQRWSRSDPGFGNHSTFMKPLLFYYKVLRSVKNTDITVDLLGGLITYVNHLTKAVVTANAFHFLDDIIRQFLAEVDKLTFILCQESAGNSLIYSSLHGLATMGGPRGWTEESVVSSLEDWVCGERSFPYEDNAYLNGKLDAWMDQWVDNIKTTDLTFSEFVTDPMRWATGGGAKKKSVIINGKEVDGRNKWFWAISGLSKGEDLYSVALGEGNDAQVALKEEVKTRCVITTPQASYLRQCYILYRLGNPTFLRSTLANPKLVSELATSRRDHFICIDSSSFDHSVTKKWILSVFDRLVSRTDGELRCVLLDEMASIREMNILYNGRKMRYENGLLSGWRMTSLLGSLLSALVCEFINLELGVKFPYIVQGDDIIMTCPKKIEASRVLDCCARFGITTNKKKTTIGRFGEFLKYRYGYGRVQGYAARAVRSIFFANPWLDMSAVSVPSEVSGKWWTLLSRVMNSHNGLFKSESDLSWFLSGIVDDVGGWLGGRVSKKLLYDAIATPISMGGLGVFEFSDVSMSKDNGFITKVVRFEEETSFGSEKFIGLFAPDVLKKVGKVTTRTLDIKKLAVNFGKDLMEFKRKFYNTINTKGRVYFESGTNIFRTVLSEIASCRSYPSIVDALLKFTSGPTSTLPKPRFLEKANRWFDIARWLTGATMKAVCPPSLFVDTRYDVDLVQSLSSVAVTMFMNLPNVTAKSEYLISVFAFSRFCHTRCILHAL